MGRPSPHWAVLFFLLGPRNRKINAFKKTRISARSRCSHPEYEFTVLCVCYLENHVFLGTRIDRKISARHVFYRRCTTASLFQLCNTEQFLHRCSWSRVIGTKTFNPHSTLIMMPRNTGIGSPSCTHPRALVGTIQASSWSRMMNLRPLLACNWGQYFTFPASDVWSETIHTLARKATLTRLPRKIRLSHRLASYLRARFKHFLMSYDESETTSGMQFVAILFISGLRLTIQKILIS